MAIAILSTGGGYENDFVDAPPDALVYTLCIHIPVVVCIVGTTIVRYYQVSILSK